MAPWWPLGAKARPWKGQNSEITDGSIVLTHFRVSVDVRGKQSSPGNPEDCDLSASRAEKLRYLEALAASLKERTWLSW